MPGHNLKESGLKTTLPRVKILQIFETSPNRHLSADDVFKQLLEMGEDIGVATVYRVLAQFEAAAIVIKHNFEDGYAVYEINQGEHHDHLICVNCNHVEEFVDEIIEARQDAIAEQHGFEITHHQMHLYGICKRENCPHRRKTQQSKD